MGGTAVTTQSGACLHSPQQLHRDGPPSDPELPGAQEKWEA